MRLQYWFDELELDEKTRATIDEKLAVLDKYLKNVPEDLEMAVVRIRPGQPTGYRVEIEMKLPGKDEIATGEDKNLLTAVDMAVGRIAGELRKKWERIRTKRGKK